MSFNKHLRIGLEAMLLVMSYSSASPQATTAEMPATRECGTMPRYQAQLKDPQFKATRLSLLNLTKAFGEVTASARFAPRTTLIHIPVVVHIIYSQDSDNISDSQVASQITVLNNDYQNKGTEINQLPQAFQSSLGNPLLDFDLAAVDPHGNPTTGITRLKTSVAKFFSDGALGDNMKLASSGGVDPWPSDQYLNIWVVGSLQDHNGKQLLGYSSFPGDMPSKDGVVILSRAFGTVGSAKSPFDKGRTATHEIGHWLNLFHVWGDDEASADVCSGSDQVDDTPNQAIANVGCPVYPHHSCNNASHGGDMFMNYMDYTNDGCMQFFTAGQVIRMEATLNGFRSSITRSRGLPQVVGPPQ
jgi:hypothetical protein